MERHDLNEKKVRHKDQQWSRYETPVDHQEDHPKDEALRLGTGYWRLGSENLKFSVSGPLGPHPKPLNPLGQIRSIARPFVKKTYLGLSW